ncbi:MAG: DinB family protein [Gemmataceae bacterium]|nr:DinB family protein [Gemmataceae bacterium]
MTTNDVIAGGYRMTKLLLHRMVDDLTPAEFRHQPVSGANSAAWIVGHLAVTLRRSAERLGVTDLPAVSPDLVAQLTQTGKPAGDQSALGNPAELLALFDTCTDRMIGAVKCVPADVLAGPAASSTRLAANFGEALLFGGLHVSMHVGQLSSIRRSLGKPPVM